MSQSLLEALRRQADFCDALQAPFSAAVMEAVRSAVEGGGEWLEVFGAWAQRDEPALTREAVPLRALGGLHHLALSGAEPQWAETFPSASGAGDATAAAALVGGLARRRRSELTEALRLPPQTNEVLRSAALLGGFLTVSDETGLPLRCLELGASAGLNQSWDAYAYRLGEAVRRGPADAPLTLQTDWRGPAPPDPAWPAVVERRGCDQAPIDVSDPAQALRLQSFVWADQVERLPRLRAAIALAVARETRIERADAVDWAETNVRPAAGTATVLFHSILRQYLSADGRERLDRVIARAAEAATAAQPFAWLRMEGYPTDGYQVHLTLWPGGKARLLAEVHPHGEWVAWKTGAESVGA